jgi:D-glycero-D-manno-heptose 1,7-bisphosphate phosphatase
MTRFIFLDRDGTINVDPGYVYKLEDFEFLPGAVDGLKILKNAGFRFIVITNQSGIGRGYFSIEQFHAFNSKLISELEKNGVKIEKTYFCPHHPEASCECRKPNPKNIRDASKEFGIDLNKSYLVGDHPHDVELGLNAGLRTIYVMSGHGARHFNGLKYKPCFIAENLLKAAEWIVDENKKQE